MQPMNGPRSRAARVWLLALLCGCASAPRPPRPGAPAPAVASRAVPTGKLPREVRPLAYHLALEIVPSRERFSGHVRIEVELAQPTARVWLHAKGLHVSRAQAEAAGTVVAGRLQQVDDEGVARLELEHSLPAGPAVLDFSYDAPFDRQLSGLYKVRAQGKDYAFTQFEPVSARQAFPCFDEPAFKTPFDVTLTVSATDVAVSNAPEVSSEPVAQGEKRVRFAITRPLPTYLIALIVGPLDVVTAAPIPPSPERAQPLPLRGVAIAGRGKQLGYALAHAGPLLIELEHYFGIAYPYPKLDLIAVPDFAAGAMENAGAITFRDSILSFSEDSASEGQVRRYANVVAHEMAHHWTGDLVTMPWWDDIWLNEAFATFMATKVVAAVDPDYHADSDLLSAVLRVMDEDSRVSARKIRQPIESTHDIVNAFDGITYQKGAGVIAMFERYLGAETFRKGVQAYLRAHADGNANAADLLAALGQQAGKDVAAPMGSFLDQVGVPLLTAEVRCDARGAALHVRQSRYLPAGSRGKREQLWQVPLCARYEVHGQAHESCTLLQQAEGELSLEGGCPDWVMPNAGGAGYYRFALADADLAKLQKAGFAKLSVREKLALADSLQAGFESGALSAQSVLATMPQLAADADRSVATAPMGLLRFARDYLLEPAQQPWLARFARALYAPGLRQLGWQERAGEDGETRLLRAQVIGFLGDMVRDPAVRAKLAALGRAWIAAGEGEARGAGADRLPADLRGAAAQVALQDGDQALFDAAWRRTRETQDLSERGILLTALSSVTDARSGRALALSLDPALRVNEVFSPLRGQLADARTREAAWRYFEQHFDALVERVSKQDAGWLPWLAWPFCSAEAADELERFFAPRIASLTGGPRSLAGATEELRLCAAEVQTQRAGVQAFFAAQK